MNISRDFANKIHFILDQLMPPILVDQKWFMKPLLYAIFGKESANMVMKFKSKVPFMNEKEYDHTYELVSPHDLKRETDLTDKSIKFIMDNLIGNHILEVPCGRGYLSGKISKDKSKNVIAADIIISEKMKAKYSNVKFVKSRIEKIPFPDNYFDTVICAHCIEHVVDISTVMKELRRVTKKRLIIVVPKQREHKYPIGLHINFFPYTNYIFFRWFYC